MDDGLKQRIIGAFVLIAIGVVFVPLIFDRERIEPVDQQTQIPIAPRIKPVVIPKPVIEDVAEPAADPEQMFVPDKNRDAVEIVDKPVLSSQGTPNSWVIQIASYRLAVHAEKMREQLIADGYSAYIRPITSDRGQMQRLYVGPNLDREKLEKIQQTIESKYGVRTLLLKFNP